MAEYRTDEVRIFKLMLHIVFFSVNSSIKFQISLRHFHGPNELVTNRTSVPAVARALRRLKMGHILLLLLLHKENVTQFDMEICNERVTPGIFMS